MKKKNILTLIFFIGVISISKAGLFGEHKQIGDSAFRRFLSTDTLKINFFRDLFDIGKDPYNNAIAILNPANLSYPRITYGDLTGLSGDHSIQPIHLFYQMLHYDPSRYFNGVPAQASFSEDELMKVLMLHHKAISEGKKAAGDISLMLAQKDYVGLASEDLSHFFVFGKTTIEEHLDTAISKYVLGNNKVNTLEYLKYHLVKPKLNGNKIEIIINQGLLDSLFQNWFLANSISKYCILHTIALDMVDQATNIYRKNKFVFNDNARLLFNMAILFNACADHYLQDTFAAGHLAEVRSKNHAPKDKGIHDYYNRIGLYVKNARGDAWLSRGDGFINNGDPNDELAVSANINSIQDLWLRFYEAKNEARKTSLIDELKSMNIAGVEKYYKENFSALNLIPIPVQKDSVHFARSKMGHYISLFLKDQKTFLNKIPLIGLQYGIGYVVSKPTSTAVRGRESNFWLGLFNVGLGYGMGRNTAQANMSLMECMFYDKLSLNVLNGGYQYSSKDKRASQFFWNPTLGIEWKKITWKMAPSVKIGMMVSNGFSYPNLTLEWRHY